MYAEIISVGTELTTGQTVDTNSAWLSRELAAVGVDVTGHCTVADDQDRLGQAILRAAGQADVVLISGGIGPTDDDVTRAALADALEKPLELRSVFVEQIEAFFAKRGRTMPAANRVQAMFPVGSQAIENTCGTAPGIRARLNDADIFVMPGVPSEMRVMFRRDVLPQLAAAADGRVLLMRCIWCYGAGESDIAERLGELMARDRNPLVGTTAQETVIGVRIFARGDSAGQAGERMEDTADEIRRRLGKLVFGVEGQTLPEAVADLLVRQSASVSTAESCTGGMLAKMLTDVPGSSRYFHSGFVTYSDEAKRRILDVDGTLIEKHGAVSGDVAVAMAEGCLRALGTDYALSVTGIAGPGGGSVEKPVGLVFIAIAGDAGTDVRKCRFGDHWLRDSIRVLSCKTALNLLRLRLLG